MSGGPQIELRPAADLVPYARNSRTHSPEQLAQIQESYRRFGMNTPIGVDADGILVGHGRVLAAVAMWENGEDVPGPGKRQPLPRGLLPTLDLSGLNTEERRAFIIADNQLALNAGWDMSILKSEVMALADADFDVSALGFDVPALADLLAPAVTALTDPNDAPPLPAVPTTVLGDLWLCGDHRILCGDSTCATDVERLLDGSVPHLMVSDPPYGVEYDPGWRNETGKDASGTTRHKSSGKVVSSTATRATGKVSNDDRADWSEAWALFPGSVAYVWHGGKHAGVVAASLEKVRLLPRAQIIWVKTRMAIGRGNYHWQHEPAFYAVREGGEDGWQDEVDVLPGSTGPDDRFEEDHGLALYAVRKGKPAQWRGGRKQRTVWEIEHLKNDTGHGTQKPVECMLRPILNNSHSGQPVYEPFLGSGTTVVAGEMSGRPVLAIELDPAYVDVAVQRWQSFTGKAATLAPRGDGVDAWAGRTFAEVAEGRA